MNQVPSLQKLSTEWTPEEPLFSRPTRWILYLLFLGVGAFLRLWNLRDQALTSDEVHALRAIRWFDFSELLYTYMTSDYCQPLTALAQWRIDHGVHLNELDFRLPSIVAGLLLLAAAPLLARWLGLGQSAWLWMGLLALSPPLVIYSRIARSYAPATLTVFLALLCFYRGWRELRWPPMMLYGILAAFSVWLHLGTLWVLVAPFAFALLDVLFISRDPRRMNSFYLALLAGFVWLSGLMLFLIPAHESLMVVLKSKAGEGRFLFSTLWESLGLQSGFRFSSLTFIYVLTVGIGFIILVQRKPRLALISISAIAFQFIALAFFKPFAIAASVIFSRYILFLTPWLLIGVAEVGSKLLARTSRSWRVPILLGGLGLVFILGPFAQRGWMDSSFYPNNDDHQYKAHEPSPAQIPEIYRQLPSGGTLIEFPWFPITRTRAFAAYQGVHQNRVLVSSPDRLFRRRGWALLNWVEPTADTFLHSKAHTVVVHFDLAREEISFGFPPGVYNRTSTAALFQRSSKRLANTLRGAWGKPDFQNTTLAVWDLERVRRQRHSSED